MWHSLTPVVAAGADQNMLFNNPKVLFVITLVIGAILIFKGFTIAKSKNTTLTKAFEDGGVSLFGAFLVVVGLSVPVVVGLMTGVVNWVGA